jgi:mono/diheme cytochrome c family protein
MKTGLSVLVSASVILAGAGLAHAAGSAEAGKALAEEVCSNCHLVEGRMTAMDAAPPFKSIANDREKTAGALRAFLTSPHGEMPDLQLTRQEIEDVAAYIQSLRRE